MMKVTKSPSFSSTRPILSSSSTDLPIKSTSSTSNTMRFMNFTQKWTNPNRRWQNSNWSEWRNFYKHNLMIRSAAKWAANLTTGVQGFEIDDNGILVRTSYKGIQIVAPHHEGAHPVHQALSLLAGHPGRRKLYFEIWKDFYFPTLAVTVT